jgi:(1->4)-alpha-D-glucan 1-alpha-D-glucosylmutase
MTLPVSTYRLQFRNGIDFGRALQLVPYLERLGISHLYAAPIMTAVSGSTHGYDATRADEIDPSLGGLDGLRKLADDLHRRGMGLILDIVPNHMAASLENPWWRSVVTWGAQSPFAHHFDIDWSQKLTLPFLGKDFAEELADGAIRLALDPETGDLALRYYDSLYPLHPETYRQVLASHEGIVVTTNPQGAEILSVTQPGARTALEKALDEISKDHTQMAAIHAAQPWQLASWKTASRHLSYRRFFEIVGLVGLRVEDPHVFEDSHRLILELVRDGTVDGLRIDHIDGLADPLDYLTRLRAAVGPDTYIIVEKILGKSEPFAAEWPVEGTTGYEFIAAMADVLVDEREGGRLAQAFAPLRDEDHQATYAQEMQASKRQMLSDNFEGEVHRLTQIAKSMADHAHADLSRSALAEAICALITALPVYRTYTTETAGVPERDRQLLATARQQALEGVRPEVREAIDFIWELLADDETCRAMPDCAEFRTRLQQLSGPIMAKALEDTLFYRENAFIALNEVGGEPGEPAGGAATFHEAMQTRAQTMPNGLSATATHDTKRGEDARARLYTLSETPDQWIAATERWSALNARFRRPHDGRTVPEADVEWLIYQSLAGVWPIGGINDRQAIQALDARMKSYIEKALREAKIGTTWSLPDIDYEQKVVRFVGDLLENEAFLTDFAETLVPYIDAGLMNSLAQTLIKLTAPGIPDIYQGSERSDFSLVDPDNRVLLDVFSPSVPEAPNPTRAQFMDYKQWLIAIALAARNERPDAFAGAYIPLALSDGGSQALAFLRGTREDFAISVVPRLTFGKTLPNALCLMDDAAFGISLLLPADFEGSTVRSVLDDRTLTLGREIPLSEIFGTGPVALLLSV